MRYALFSDVHSNLEALEAVFSALSKEEIDEYLCIGDIVGYGADPKMCLDKVKTKAAHIVAGNHERAVAGLFSLDNLTSYARDAVIWTKGVLGSGERDFFKSLGLIFENEDLIMVHGSLDEPETFRYLFRPYEARETFELLNKPRAGVTTGPSKNICFIAHTHSPRIFVRRNVIISLISGYKAVVNPDYGYVVNVGSVGQPRDRDVDAAYSIYDTAAQEVEIKRVSYDVRAAQNKIINAGLPQFLADRLAAGR